MDRKIKIKKGYRNFAFERGEINEENMTVDLSFSSEEPVKRWFGTEILDHSRESADLDRLNNSAAVLIDHYSDQIGVVEKAWIDTEEKKGKAVLRFSKSNRGREVFEDIKDGIRKNVSFGYMVNAIDLEKEKDGEKTYRSYDWTPYEISIVSVPADTSVGVGRDAEIEKEIEVKGEEKEVIKKDFDIDSKLIINKLKAIA